MLIGLAAGAAGAWLAVRSRLELGDAAARTLHEREVELAGAVAELEVERRMADDRLATAAKALSADALRENNAAFLALAETKLSGYVKPLKESLEKVDGHVQHLEQARERSFGALSKEVALLRRPNDPARERPPRTPRAGPLGRGAAPARRGARRHGRALRLRRAGVGPGRRGRAAAPRPGREAARRQARRRRCEGAGGRLLRRIRDGGRRASRRAPREPRPSGARPRRQARRQGLLAPVRADAGLRRHVPPR